MTDDVIPDSRQEGHRRAIDGLLRTEFGQRKTSVGERAINRLRVMASVDGDNAPVRTATEQLSAVVIGRAPKVSERHTTTPRRGTPASKRNSTRDLRLDATSRMRPWWGVVAALLMVGVVSIIFMAQLNTSGDLRLTSVIGAATITHANGSTSLARPGMIVSTEDIVSIGTSSTVVAQFADGTVMTSGNGSEWLNESGEAGKRVRLLIGSLTAKVAKQDPEKPFMVISNDAEVTVVGTELTCHHRGSSRVSVTTGEVDVRRRSDNVETTVAAGQEVAVGLDAPLEVVKLGQAKQEEQPYVSDGKGNGTGLFAQYFQNQNFTNEVFTRIDPTIDFNFGITQAIDPRIQLGTYSIRWTGEIEPKYTGTHWFRTLSDDGIRIWIDGKLIIERWTEHHATWDDGTIDLVAGKRYPIRIEYDQWQRHAVLRVFWKVMGHPLTILDRSQLYPTKPSE